MKQRYQVSCGIRTEARPGAHDQRIHLQIAALDANVEVYYEFVPSLCNVADLPSRDDFKLLEEQGGRAQLCSSRQHPTGRARWTFGTNGLEIRPTVSQAQEPLQRLRASAQAK